MGEEAREGREGEAGEEVKAASRKEKRKERKKTKRRDARREAAEREREEEERRMNDPDEQRRAREKEEAEKARAEAERRAFEERERVWVEEMERRRREKEAAAEKEEEEKALQAGKGNLSEEDDDWEYEEEGPAEIIWQGNEIIVRKKKIRVPKKNSSQCGREEDADRPISNPLPPQFEAFSEHQLASSAQQILENVAQQVPNFGTEQDKAHCPFHLKTGVCRFGQRCSRVHFYPDKSCTLLMKNMYNGPGIVWEQDEGLEYTDEEVERFFEEFYEDVHTEFLKFGELVNFKVCKNGSFHLRGNVYAHYKLVDSALVAYQSINGRFFAGKRVQCEFVNVTRWKTAICGEYMKSRHRTCSHGVACNFIHCFRNPGGDYEWADWDKPAPRYWVEKMISLFGYTGESVYEKQTEHGNSNSSRSRKADTYRHRSRSKSHSTDQLISSSGRSDLAEDSVQKIHRDCRHMEDSSEQDKFHHRTSCEKNFKTKDHHHSESRTSGSDSDEGWLSRDAVRGRARNNRQNSRSKRTSTFCRELSEISTDSEEKRRGTSLRDLEWSDGGDEGRVGLSNLLEDPHRKELASQVNSSSKVGRTRKIADANTAADRPLHVAEHGRRTHHQKKKGSRGRQSGSENDEVDDRYRRRGSNSSDDQYIWEKEKYQCAKRKWSRVTISDDRSDTPKRSKQKSDSDKSETEKSGYRGKPDDSDSRYSRIQEIVEQDRWRPDSPEALSYTRSEPVDSDEDNYTSKQMYRRDPHQSTSWDKTSTEFYADSRSRGSSYQSNKKHPWHDESTKDSQSHREVDGDNRIHDPKHRSRRRKELENEH